MKKKLSPIGTTGLIQVKQPAISGQFLDDSKASVRFGRTRTGWKIADGVNLVAPKNAAFFVASFRTDE